MKLGEMLDRLDSPVDGNFDSTALIEELGLSDWVNLGNHGFVSRPITVWCCTDTWVGRKAIYLNGELVAITNQECRKCSVTWEWTSRAAYYRTYQAVLSALDDDTNNRCIQIMDRDADVGDPMYRLSYANEVLWNGPHKWALYEGRLVVVIGAGSKDYLCASLRIKDGDDTKTVSLEKIYFTVPLRDQAA